MRTFNCVSRLFRLLPVFMSVVSVLQVHSAFGMSGSPEQRDSLFSVSDSTYRQVIREGARSMSCYLTYPQSRTQVLPDFENNASELGKLDGCTAEEAEEISRIVGLGALKYFILKVDPRKNMTFNPKESIDFNGNTGPFIQYTHARICSVMRKAAEAGIDYRQVDTAKVDPSEKEISLIQHLADFPAVVAEAGRIYSPSLIANYVYDLVKEYNQFYHDYSILREENAEVRAFRLMLSANVAKVIKTGMGLLGIEVPDRM